MTAVTLQSKTSKVYKNKKLNTANYSDFNLNDYQVFLHLITKIGGVDEKGKYLQQEELQREYILTAKEFSNIFNSTSTNCYRIIKKACKKLMRTSITIERFESNSIWEVNICSSALYNENSGNIVIKFTDDIMPYLAQVKQKFVLYNLKEIANFGSLYTTRLYELIQEFKDTGWFVKSVSQLKEFFAVGHKFALYADFKRKTFGHACREINNNYEMNLSFEEVKEGRKVVAIKFIFRKTKVHKAINQRTGKSQNIYEKPAIKENKKEQPLLERSTARKVGDVIFNLPMFKKN